VVLTAPAVEELAVSHRLKIVRRPGRPLGAGRQAVAPRSTRWMLPALAPAATAALVVIPWMSVPLRGDVGPLSLRVSAAGMTAPSAVSYGALLIVLQVVAILALAARRSWSRGLMGLAGLATAALPVLYLTDLRYANNGALGALAHSAADYRLLVKQFKYTVGTTPPSSALGLGLDPHWNLIASLARVGLLAVTAAGVIQAVSCRVAVGHLIRASRTGVVVCGLAAVVVAAASGRVIYAASVNGRGFSQLAAGNFQPALDSFKDAQSLVPTLAGDRDTDLAIGRAMFDLGARHTPFTLLAQSQQAFYAGDHRGQVEDLVEAVQLAPTSADLREQLLEVAISLSIGANDASLLLLVPPALLHNSAVAQYTLARLAYALGDFAVAIPEMRAVTALTSDRNVSSSVYTYIGLAEMKMGETIQGRADLVRAVHLDTADDNALARSYLTGLYEAVPS